MFFIFIMMALIILLLLKLNYDALKKLKQIQHENINSIQIKKVNRELVLKLEEARRLHKLSEYRLERSIHNNFILWEKYNLATQAPIDIPYKSHRYFFLHPTELPVYNFNEN